MDKRVGFVCFGEVNTPIERLQMKHDEASYRKMLINEGRMKERETLLKAMRENGFSPEMIAKIYGDEARQ